MRLTGQATTALGNVIVNLLIHSRLALEHEPNWAVFLGDDMLMGLKSEVEEEGIINRTRQLFNM